MRPPPIIGIYGIQHLDSGRVYIGQASDVKKRWSDHRSLLRVGRAKNPHLQAAWDKYGEATFVFMVLVECQVDQLTGEEQRCLDLLPLELKFNLHGALPSANRGKKHNSAAIEKMVNARRNFYQDRRNREASAVRSRAFAIANPEQTAARVRAMHSETSVAKMSATQKRRMEDPASRVRLSQAHGGRAVVARHAMTGEILTFDYVSQVKERGFNPKSVFGVLAGRCQKHRGYEWSYKDGAQ